ncbi:MAG: hypothetical protein ACK4YQ_06615 [Phenylobacterium sp.]|uniref:hypothetical protein n=1 Tax=Phenylobacterium sp. TaxID=1871053 RepID=UPI00391BFE45
MDTRNGVARLPDATIAANEDEHDIALQRYVMRLGLDFFVRLATACSELFEGNLLTGLIFVAIAQSSVQHLNKPLRLNPSAVDGVFPDELRRPVSVLGLAQFLGLPYETTRRHVNRLVELGYVNKVGARGVITPSEVMRRPEVDRLVAANFSSVRQFVAGLRNGASELLEA